jgi:glutamate racemase
MNIGCKIVLFACNTVSTTLINALRICFAVPFIAMEPMVKPGAIVTKIKMIAVCATPTTLASQHYRWLKHTYASDVQVLEPNSSDWSYMIEHEQFDQKNCFDY